MEGAQASTKRKRRSKLARRSHTSQFFNDNEAASPAPPPPRFARFASSSGPPPPLSRGRKGLRSRGASLESKSIANDRKFSYRFVLFAFPIHSRKKTVQKAKGAERRQTQGVLSEPRERMLPLARASGPARAEAQRARLPAFRRGTCGGERTPPLNFSPHFLGPGVIRCYLHLACPFSPASCLAVPVIVPDGRIRRSRPGAGYEAARGNRTRSVSGIVSRNALTRASFFCVTDEETDVNGKVTTIVAASFYPGPLLSTQGSCPKIFCRSRAAGKCASYKCYDWDIVQTRSAAAPLAARGKGGVDGWNRQTVNGGNRGLCGWVRLGSAGADRGDGPDPVHDPEFQLRPRSITAAGLVALFHPQPLAPRRGQDARQEPVRQDQGKGRHAAGADRDHVGAAHSSKRPGPPPSHDAAPSGGSGTPASPPPATPAKKNNDDQPAFQPSR